MPQITAPTGRSAPTTMTSWRASSRTSTASTCAPSSMHRSAELKATGNAIGCCSPSCVAVSDREAPPQRSAGGRFADTKSVPRRPPGAMKYRCGRRRQFDRRTPGTDTREPAFPEAPWQGQDCRRSTRWSPTTSSESLKIASRLGAQRPTDGQRPRRHCDRAGRRRGQEARAFLIEHGLHLAFLAHVDAPGFRTLSLGEAVEVTRPWGPPWRCA
jgi:hypothetical protein